MADGLAQWDAVFPRRRLIRISVPSRIRTNPTYVVGRHEREPVSGSGEPTGIVGAIVVVVVVAATVVVGAIVVVVAAIVVVVVGAIVVVVGAIVVVVVAAMVVVVVVGDVLVSAIVSTWPSATP